MATIEQLSAALVKADAAGDTAAARALAAELRRVQASSKPKAAPDPAAGGSTLKVLNPFGKDFDTGINLGEGATQTLAGVGKAFADTGRGVGQMLGLVDRKDVAEMRKMDAPLMATTAGKAGNILGNIAIAAPTVAIPGANTVSGAALIGGVQGLVQPSTSTSETLQNIGLGGALGGGTVVAGRAIGGLYGGAKALAEPFTRAGREKIAGRMIQRFAKDPASVARATSTPTITGAVPTLAEQTGDRGLAQLQDALRSVDPQIANQIAQRLADNNAARVGTLHALGGDSVQRAAAATARESATAPLYQTATAQQVTISPELQALFQRPSVQKALARAENIAAEQGRPFNLGDGKATGQTLQDLKMGMDALLKDPTSGIAGAEAASVKATRDAIVAEMERAIPEFRAARTGYAALSRPLNAMDIGEHIARKATSNTSDLAGNPRMQANALLGLLRDEPGLIAQATGRKGLGNSLANIFDPDQMARLRAVAEEADRAAAVATAGNGPGSATAQRMASQNILRQLIGPTGLPESWAESALANTVLGKPFNLVYGGVAEPKIQQALAEAVLNPEAAQRMLQAGVPAAAGAPNPLLELMRQATRMAPSTVATTRER